MADWIGVDVFELTTCVMVDGKGRDCLGPRAEWSPLPLCLKHLREAYLAYAERLQYLKEITPTDRDDASKMPVQPGSFADDRDCIVYYIRIGHFVKIGTTVDMAGRMSSLQPDEVLATELGSYDLETQRHRAVCAHPGAEGTRVLLSDRRAAGPHRRGEDAMGRAGSSPAGTQGRPPGLRHLPGLRPQGRLPQAGARAGQLRILRIRAAGHGRACLTMIRSRVTLHASTTSLSTEPRALAKGCGAQLRRARRRGLAEAWLTRRQAAFLAKVTIDVIKQWRYRGWIDSHGRRRHITVKNGHYLHSDVMEAERDTRQKAQRSHRRCEPASLKANDPAGQRSLKAG